jgi:DMSO/TMAO reductase YedYZ molybdopterin-dependent catalytic subunit
MKSRKESSMSSTHRVATLVVAVLLLGACAQAKPEPTATLAPPPSPTALPPSPTATATAEAEPTTAPEPAEVEVVLTITGIEQTVSLTMADLQAMPAVEGWGGIKNSTGRITVPAVYKGVALTDLVGLVGGLDETAAISVVAEDGYAMTLAYDQVANGDFVAYDPGVGDETDPGEQLTAALAYEVDGEPLPVASDGRLRLVVLGSRNNQVTDGHWWVKWVNAIEVKSQGEEWFLSLTGAISEEMDRATFESCSSPNCHGTTWNDAEGHEWTGTPLFLVAARIDDENQHDFGGFNVNLAEAGYTIELVAADDYRVEIASQDASRNTDMIVAITMDGEPLPEKYYPLRLVGATLDNSQMVGQIAAVNVIFQAGEGTGEMSGSAAGEAALTVTGLVEHELELDSQTLETMDIVERTVEHPKKGPQTYQGILLNDLLGRAGPKWEATSLVFKAADGYSAAVDLADVKDCTDCMIALVEEGGLQSVMPGMESMTWVKDLIEIELVVSAGEGDESGQEASPAGDLPQAPEGEAALTVSGLVAQELTLSLETLQGMNVVEITAEHPKTGAAETYQGVLLSEVLAYAQPASEATVLAFTAADGYSAELGLQSALNCADCLVAFDQDGSLKMVMPAMESMLWVKELVGIDVR